MLKQSSHSPWNLHMSWGVLVLIRNSQVIYHHIDVWKVPFVIRLYKFAQQRRKTDWDFDWLGLNLEYIWVDKPIWDDLVCNCWNFGREWPWKVPKVALDLVNNFSRVIRPITSSVRIEDARLFSHALDLITHSNWPKCCNSLSVWIHTSYISYVNHLVPQ